MTLTWGLDPGARDREGGGFGVAEADVEVGNGDEELEPDPEEEEEGGEDRHTSAACDTEWYGDQPLG